MRGRNGALEVVTTFNMKSHLLRSLMFIAALAVSAFATESFRSFELNLAPGSSPATVQRKLGAPSAVLGRDVWVYFEFSKSNPNVANPKFDTLVIAFADARVAAVKITDGRIVRQLLAQQAAHQARVSVAVK